MNNFFKYVIGGLLAVSSLALIISAPRTARNLKPLKNERMQESQMFNVFTDKETGDMYGYIDGPAGERRFVKLDKNSENKVRQEKINYEIAIAKASVDEKDEVSAQTFSFDTNWEGYEINTFLKYRPDGRSGDLRYRIAFKAPEKILEKGQSESIKCKFSSGKEKELKNLAANQDNYLRLRFKDKDDFWIQDLEIALGTDLAEDFSSTSIDATSRDDCDKLNKLVFHGTIESYFPDFSLVKDGKLLFNDVKITNPPDDSK